MVSDPAYTKAVLAGVPWEEFKVVAEDKETPHTSIRIAKDIERALKAKKRANTAPRNLTERNRLCAVFNFMNKSSNKGMSHLAKDAKLGCLIAKN